MGSLPKFVFLRLDYPTTSLVGYSTSGLCSLSLGDFYGKLVTKFQVEPAAKTSSDPGDGDMVHIKSCYNNKYWVLKSQNDSVLAATAKETNEDRSNWACTLFRAKIDEEKKTVYFMHVQTGYAVNLFPDGYLHATEAAYVSFNMCFTDAERLVILPKQVAFKFVDNGTVKYLKAYTEGDGQSLQLQFTVIDPADPLVGNEIFYNFDGSIILWNKYYRRFWRAIGKWIFADAKSTDSSDDNPWNGVRDFPSNGTPEDGG